jgi:8-oxo-dGTP pyrophosphatase MutT (NUDIX family)
MGQVDARGFMGLVYRAEVAWGPSVMTVAAILRRADRVLLVRETRAEIEVWGPPGRIVEAGELLTEAVVREVNEETGLLVERIGPSEGHQVGARLRTAHRDQPSER